MHRDHNNFVRATNQKRKVRLTFFSDEDGHKLVRMCAPLYYSQGQTEGDDLGCYYLWDFESSTGKRFLGLSPSQIVSMKPTEEAFDPRRVYRAWRDLAETKTGQHNNGSIADFKEFISREIVPEKDSEIGKLASRLVGQAEKAKTSEKKEPAGKSNNTAGQGADTNEEK